MANDLAACMIAKKTIGRHTNMARRRRNKKLLEIAIESPWHIAAVLAVVFFLLGFVILPSILKGNPFTGSLVSIGQTALGLVGLLFASIALVKFLIQWGSPKGQAVTVWPQKSSNARSPIQNKNPSRLDNAWNDAFLSDQRKQDEHSLAKPTAWSLNLLQTIEWKRFEDLCAAFYKEKGIRCETTPLGADGGVDIRLFQDESSPQATAVVQCKAWGERLVGVKPIRELLGVMAHEKIAKSFFMAPGGFTVDAREFAQANRITLLDGKLFLSMLERLPAEAKQKLLAFATSGDYTTPSCPSCGIKMLQRNGSRGDFWGCQNYPRCRQTLPRRKLVS